MNIFQRIKEKVTSSGVSGFMFILLGATFFVGIWHAFPMLNVINDEMYFVGGVLRAMQAHTVIPFPDDVPYGTLTYICNYIMSFPILFILLMFFKLNINELKLFLVQSPQIMYFSLRFMNAIFSLGILFFINKILKKEFENWKIRFFLIILLFTNIITTLIMHTGKMWVTSVFLVIVSFFYLHKVIFSLNAKDTYSNDKDVFLSVLFSFLAFSNFPLNFFSLINIPILFYFFRKDSKHLIKICQYVVFGFVAYLLVTIFNFVSIKNEIVSIFTGYHPINSGLTQNLGFGKSLLSYTIKFLSLFPILIITLILSINKKIKNQKLFNISSIYFLTYFFVIVLVANWPTGLADSLRYLFPLGFFLVFIIASFNLEFKKIFYVLGLISLIYFVFTLYYLSVSTTYNKAYNWINDNLSNENVTVVNHVSELQLIKNKKSSLLVKNKSCATKCQNIISHDLNSDFRPLVIDFDSIVVDFTKTNQKIYYIEEKPLAGNVSEVWEWVNPSSDYHSVDYNMGSYFDLDFFKIKNLGRNIYIYENTP